MSGRWGRTTAVVVAFAGALACSSGDAGDAGGEAEPAPVTAPAPEDGAPAAYEGELHRVGRSIRIGYLPPGFVRTMEPNAPGEVIEPSPTSGESFGFHLRPNGVTTVPGIVVTVSSVDDAPGDLLAEHAERTLVSPKGIAWWDLSPDDEWNSVVRVLDDRVTLFVNGRDVGFDELMAVGDSIEVAP